QNGFVDGLRSFLKLGWKLNESDLIEAAKQSKSRVLRWALSRGVVISKQLLSAFIESPLNFEFYEADSVIAETEKMVQFFVDVGFKFDRSCFKQAVRWRNLALVACYLQNNWDSGLDEVLREIRVENGCIELSQYNFLVCVEYFDSQMKSI